jgi:hypothetical protein
VGILLSKLKFPALAFLNPDTVRLDEGWCHRFQIPGISFSLTLGGKSPAFKAGCFYHSPAHPIAIATDGDERMQREALRLIGKVAPPWGEYPLIEGVEGEQQGGN